MNTLNTVWNATDSAPSAWTKLSPTAVNPAPIGVVFNERNRQKHHHYQETFSIVAVNVTVVNTPLARAGTTLDATRLPYCCLIGTLHKEQNAKGKTAKTRRTKHVHRGCVHVLAPCHAMSASSYSALLLY